MDELIKEAKETLKLANSELKKKWQTNQQRRRRVRRQVNPRNDLFSNDAGENIDPQM